MEWASTTGVPPPALKMNVQRAGCMTVTANETCWGRHGWTLSPTQLRTVRSMAPNTDVAFGSHVASSVAPRRVAATVEAMGHGHLGWLRT